MATAVASTPDDGNRVQKKLLLDEVLECASCKDPISSSPMTLRQCLHSFCSTCLTKLPRTEKNGYRGWVCPDCKTFSTEGSLRQNEFLEDLRSVANMNFEFEGCKQCYSKIKVTKKCEDCKTELCEDCQAIHLRIPMLKDHHLIDIDDKNAMHAIDKLVYCRYHPSKLVKYNCKTCQIQTCSVCNLTSHNTHVIETVEEAIDRLLPEMQTNAKNVNKNLYKIQKQIESVSSKIEEVKQNYSAAKIEMDTELEKCINSLKMKRAKVEEEMNEKESEALDKLQQIKKRLKFHQNKLKNIYRLTKVTTDTARKSSLLNELQSGLFDNLKELGSEKKDDENFEIKLPLFHRGDNTIEEEWNFLVGETTYGNSFGIIDTLGINWTDNRYMCENFSAFTQKRMEKATEVKVSSLWCNGFSYIDTQIWIGFPSNNKLLVYNNDGVLQRTIETNKVTAIKKTGNGDLVACGFYGLYVTNQDCNLWTKICGGKYSDVYVHGKRFSALQYDNPRVVTYQLVMNMDTEQTQWALVGSFDLPEQYFGQHDSMNKIVVDKSNTIMVSKCGNKKAIFTFTEQGTLQYIQDTRNWEPLLCGMDNNEAMLIANYQQGKLYVVESIHDLGSEINMIDMEVKFKGDELLDAIVDYDCNIWTLQGNKDKYCMVKYSCPGRGSSLKDIFVSSH